MPDYVYSPIDSSASEIRLLTVFFNVKDHISNPKETPLLGRLKSYSLPSVDLSIRKRVQRNVKLPTYTALSYVWGESTRKHELLVDGKSIPVTSNLYAALCQIRSDTPWEFHIWVDAICIDQSNLPERSSQIHLMRQIYSRAFDVLIWLGPGSSESLSGMRFIAQLTGDWATNKDEASPGQKLHSDGTSAGSEEEDTAVEEAILKGILKTSGAFANGALGLLAVGQGLRLGVRATENIFKDGRADLVLPTDEKQFLSGDAVTRYAEWRPEKKNLHKVLADYDFEEIADLIGKAILNDTEWFKRMWVLQEVGVAQAAHIQLGSFYLEWEDFLRATHYLHYTCKASIDGMREVTVLERIRMAWETGKRHPLRGLIRESRYRLATDPKDKIYSVLGLMGDRMNDLLQPDYDKEVNEVYANATRHLISETKSLNPICGQQIDGRREDLPSWVPDFQLDQDLAPALLVAINGNEELFAAAGYDHRSAYTFPDGDFAHHAWSTLKTVGVCIGAVENISEAAQADESFACLEKRYYATIRNFCKHYEKEILRLLANISNLVSDYSRYWEAADRANFQFEAATIARTREIVSTVLDDTSIAYISTLLCGRISNTERITRKELIAILSGHSSTGQPATRTIDQNFLNMICTSFISGLRRRRFLLTSDKTMGAGPAQSQLGDLICVLFGCSVPVVLRKREDREGSGYRLIGECYMHGFMDAEGLVMEIKGQRKVDEFVLR